MDNIKAALQAAAEQENITLAELVRLRAFNQRLVEMIISMQAAMAAIPEVHRMADFNLTLAASNKLITAIHLTPRHATYIAGVKARGIATVTYTMPCCGGHGETQVAPEGEEWSTSATCHHCGEMYVKLTDGATVRVSL